MAVLYVTDVQKTLRKSSCNDVYVRDNYQAAIYNSMAKSINDLTQLKTLFGADAPQKSNVLKRTKQEKKLSNDSESGKAKTNPLEDGILHSYLRNVVDNNEVYDIMKDTEEEGQLFQTLAESYQNELIKDLVEYFACCFFNGDYSLLDTFASQCEDGFTKTPSENASILGHKVSITYQQEYDIIARLFELALVIDKRMNDEPQTVQYVYAPPTNTNTQTSTPIRKPNAGGTERELVKISLDKPIHKTVPHKAPKKKPEINKKPKKTNNFPKVSIGNHTLVGTGLKRGGIISSPSIRRKSFSSHIANSGVWGRIASYGGFNGRLIYINAGHGR